VRVCVKALTRLAAPRHPLPEGRGGFNPLSRLREPFSLSADAGEGLNSPLPARERVASESEAGESFRL
jgi:hypothetical protein